MKSIGHAKNSMTAEVFLDSNILVYAARGTASEERKRRRALELIETEKFGISAQVLQEFFVNVIKKSSTPLSPKEVMTWVEQLLRFPCQAIDQRLVRDAIAQSVRYRISYWDGAIIAAAHSLGCHTVYSEDLNSGQMYGSVRVVNPFRTQ